MSKSELKNSVRKMKIMVLKEMKFQMMNTCLTLQSCNCTSTNPVFQKSPKENRRGKKSSDSEDTSRIGNTL